MFYPFSFCVSKCIHRLVFLSFLLEEREHAVNTSSSSSFSCSVVLLLSGKYKSLTWALFHHRARKLPAVICRFSFLSHVPHLICHGLISKSKAQPLSPFPCHSHQSHPLSPSCCSGPLWLLAHIPTPPRSALRSALRTA